MSAAATPETVPSGVGRSSPWHALFVAPYLALLVSLIAVPVAIGLWLSFQDYDMLGGYNGFVGLGNYVDLAHDATFRRAVLNTMLFVAITVPTFLVLGLFLALSLNRPFRTSALFRSIFFGSSVLSVTVVTLIWRLVYMPDRGLLADVLALIGLRAPDIVSSTYLALPGIAVVTVWWVIGLPMTLFLAGLQQIPRELYEAAALDNASRTRTLLFITIPQLRRTIVIVSLIELVKQFQVFGQVLLITSGGPDNASRTVVQAIYEAGFRDWQVGYAAAASQVLFGLMLIAALVQLWAGSRREAS